MPGSLPLPQDKEGGHRGLTKTTPPSPLTEAGICLSQVLPTLTSETALLLPMAPSRAGGPLTYPRWSRGQKSSGRNSCLLPGSSGSRCWGRGGGGRFPRPGWGGGRGSPSPDWGGGGPSSLDRRAGSSPRSAAAAAAPAAGRAWAPARQTRGFPFFFWLPLRRHWTPATQATSGAGLRRVCAFQGPRPL